MPRPLILIVEDDKDYLELLHEALENEFDVKCASNFFEADKLTATIDKFDIALVDECVGDDKGSEWIKVNAAGANVAHSFVLYSGLATESTILKGLECGADDFLAKPISLLALNSKLHKLINYQNKIRTFETEINSKDRVINVSLAQASKYGSCMQLTSRLNQCYTQEKIREEIFSFLFNMKLQGCLAFYPLKNEPAFFHSEKGFCSPVEISVMKLLKDKPRLHRFGNRAIFNHPLASILILHLDDDSIDTDIYIDALASVIECVGSRMTFIAYQSSLLNVQSEIKKAVFTTKQMIESSKNNQQEIMNEIVLSMGVSFHVLDMNTEQEEYLTNLVHNALRKHSQDDINFLEVSQLLDNALGSLESLNDLNQEVVEIEEEEDELF